MKCFGVQSRRWLTSNTSRSASEACRSISTSEPVALFAAAESEAIGQGGISAVWAATGILRRVIRQGKKELHARASKPEGRLRRPGGGRKRTVVQDPSLLVNLERLLESVTCGHPDSPLRWTCKSVRKLAEQLERQGHATSYRAVARLLEYITRRTGLPGE